MHNCDGFLNKNPDHSAGIYLNFRKLWWIEPVTRTKFWYWKFFNAEEDLKLGGDSVSATIPIIK